MDHVCAELHGTAALFMVNACFHSVCVHVCVCVCVCVCVFACVCVCVIAIDLKLHDIRFRSHSNKRIIIHFSLEQGRYWVSDNVRPFINTETEGHC